MLKYKRVLFKVSGESLMGDKPFGHDMNAIKKTCEEIVSIHKAGAEISVVVGGGNIFRGVSATSEIMDRASADYMGMLATVMNGIAFGQSGSARYIKSKRSFDIAYTIEDNVFKHNGVQLQIEDIRPSEEYV